MRYNDNGDLLAGVGGSILSVNKKPIPNVIGGGGRWLNDDTVLANADYQGVWALYEFDRVTGWAPRFADPFNPRGASRVGAGGNNWAATLESTPYVTYGWFKDAVLPYRFTASHVMDGSAEGSLIFASSDYLSIEVLWWDGKLDIYPVGPHVLWDSVRFVPGGFCYVTDPLQLHFQPRGGALRDVWTVEGPYQPSSAIDNLGRRWWLYHGSRTILQLEDTDRGFTWPAGYGPALDVTEDWAIVARALNEAESPDQIVIEAAVDLLNPQPIESGYVIPTYAPFTHRVSIAPFKDLNGMSGADSEILVNGMVQDHPRPCWATLDCLGGVKGELLGIYCQTTPADLFGDLEEVLPIAAKMRTRILICNDGAGPFPPAVLARLRSYDVPMNEGYRLRGQPLAFDKLRWYQNLVALLHDWPGDVGHVPMFYCQGGAPPNELWPVQDVLDAETTISELVNLSPRVKLVAPFEFDRANGISAHPPIMESFDRLLEATPGPATFHPIPPVPPPAVANRVLILKESIMDGPIPVLNHSQFKPASDGKFTVTVGNPLNQTYTNVGVRGWQSHDPYIGKDAVLSVDSAGNVSTRSPDHAGTDETCSKVAGCAVFENTFEGNPVSFLIPYDSVK